MTRLPVLAKILAAAGIIASMLAMGRRIRDLELIQDGHLIDHDHQPSNPRKETQQ